MKSDKMKKMLSFTLDLTKQQAYLLIENIQ